ncbi:MAG: TetR/AcrR family transcriptional regulator [Spirochaetales bacterium]|nr:TetR/AcrR family transcriptional regulator [Spirochaetales bacterium]
MSKRDSLLRAGERMFSSYGYRDVNVSDITEETGLGTGTFYIYFKSKEDFYGQIIERIEQRGIRSIDKLINSFHSPLNKLKALYRFATLALKQNSILQGLITRNKKYIYPGLNDNYPRTNPLTKHIRGLILSVIREGNEKRLFRSGIYKNPENMLFAIYSAVVSEYSSTNIEELMDDILLLIERGMKRRLRLRNRDERLDKRKRRAKMKK